MSKTVRLRTPLLSILVLALLVSGRAAFGQSSDYLVKQNKPDRRLSIVQHALHHPTHGTGFVAEIDLAKLPDWKGELKIIPVEDPNPGTMVTSRPSSKQYDMHGNPLNTAITGIARLFTLFAIKREKRPLVLQTVFPLDSGLVRNEDGTITVRQVPPDQKIHIHIPHALVRDSGRVYFVLPDSIFNYPQEYLFTPELFPDTLMPDLQVKVLKTVDTRYAGASGQMVTVGYYVPEYLKTGQSRCGYMQPEITLNGKYKVYRPKSYLYPAEWGALSYTFKEWTFFIPYAFFDEEGKSEVEIGCQCLWDKRRRMAEVSLELQAEKKEKVKVEIAVEKMVRKGNLSRKFTNVKLRLNFKLGGVSIGMTSPSEQPPNNAPLWTWMSTWPAAFEAIRNDSINIRAISESIYKQNENAFYASFFLELNEIMSEDFRMMLKYDRISILPNKKIKEFYRLFFSNVTTKE